jgi:hypothetical protein
MLNVNLIHFFLSLSLPITAGITTLRRAKEICS